MLCKVTFIFPYAIMAWTSESVINVLMAWTSEGSFPDFTLNIVD